MVESEDIHYGMKKLALHNWREPDVPKYFPQLTEDVWVPAVMEPKLTSAVPEEIARLFEIARGSILYGWLFYPLLTLAKEQLYRVQEAAVRARSKQAGVATERVKKNGDCVPRNFGELITELVSAGIIPADAIVFWENARQLRNQVSHPERPTIMPPGAALGGIQVAANRINQLFSSNPDFFSVLGQRVQNATGLGDPKQVFPVVVGIDVGASKKGFHLVALRGSEILGTLATKYPDEAAQWCKIRAAEFVGVDAPCAWCNPLQPRMSENILRRMGYTLYATPTREAALQNPAFAWMLNGERLYGSLRKLFPLFNSSDDKPPFCFETYPYVASCAYAGRKLRAGDKDRDRRQILKSGGVDETILRNGDFVDAGICALVAISVAIDNATARGDVGDGYIVTPPWPPGLSIDPNAPEVISDEDGAPIR